MSTKPELGVYYRIKVKGSRKNTLYTIDYATWIDGEWYTRRYFNETNSDDAFVDRNSYTGFDYVPLGEGMTVTSFEKMEDQKETKEDYYD